MTEIDQVKIINTKIDTINESVAESQEEITGLREDLTAGLEDLQQQIDEGVSTGVFYIDVKPTETVEKRIWNSAAKAPSSWLAGRQAYSVYTVTEGITYFASGTTESAGNYPLISFYDADDNFLSKSGTDNNTTYVDHEATAPAGAVKAIVNTCAYILDPNTYDATPPRLRYTVTNTVKNEELDQRMISVEKKTSQAFFVPQMESVLRLSERNPFAFAPFDKGYVSFVFDDLRLQQDSVASIFESYNMPLCLAAIPDAFNSIATGLTVARGNYTPGMTMKQVCDQVVADGGEIFTHNGPVVTAVNQYDYDFMYTYFVEQKKKLEAAGYTIRGLIRAGGTGFIQKSPETAKWVEAFYEYSDFGYSVNHSLQRININQDVSIIKAAIDSAVANKKWIQIYGHDYDYGGGTTLTCEADLMEILDYCQSAGITVCTYSYIFDNFSSSYFAEGGGGGGGSSELTYIVAEPTQHISGSIWNARTNSAYGTDKPQYDCKIYTVTSGEKYKVSGGSAGYPSDYPCCAFFASASASTALEKYGLDASTKYTDLDVTVPAGATIMVVNCYDSLSNPATEAKKGVDALGMLEARVAALEEAIINGGS